MKQKNLFSWSVEERESMLVLHSLKPGILQNIVIRDGIRRRSINRIVIMDQWKQAEHLELYGFNLPSIEHLFHFTTIEMEYQKFSVEDLVQLCNGLSRSINFESYTMKTRERLDTEAIKEALNLQQTTSPGIYSIPNSNLVVEFSWGSRVLKLSKCSV
ncbi:hypothetical protein CRE_30021 [Caenorhabditis remanei]|uniref:DUF38 domain-containing protein n=1 Tax=Caenorhabditis remanei TaxID=31234 RepID=E3MM83_CAERE|nr:hypothetical protein CRE_30021 [Caenorhabditis remanei]